MSIGQLLVHRPSANYLCSRCDELPLVPYQHSPCGNRFCAECKESLLSTSNVCPICEDAIDVSSIFPDKAAKREIEVYEIRCPFYNRGCDVIILIKDLDTHLGQCSAVPTTELPRQGNEEAFVKRLDGVERQLAELTKSVEGTSNQVASLIAWKTDLTLCKSDSASGSGNAVNLTRRLELVEAKVASMMQMLGGSSHTNLETHLSRLMQSYQDMEARLTAQQEISYDGVLLWRIDNYHQRKKDAVDGVRRSVYSPTFYSSRFGYKMCIRAYLNGDGIGRGEYLSLFFVLMKGENDPVLDFPFPLRVKFTLLDQDTRTRNLSDSFDPDCKSSSFQRPVSALNVGAGCPKFVRHSIAESSTYLKDDCIYFKIAVGRD